MSFCNFLKLLRKRQKIVRKMYKSAIFLTFAHRSDIFYNARCPKMARKLNLRYKLDFKKNPIEKIYFLRQERSVSKCLSNMISKWTSSPERSGRKKSWKSGVNIFLDFFNYCRKWYPLGRSGVLYGSSRKISR